MGIWKDKKEYGYICQETYIYITNKLERNKGVYFATVGRERRGVLELIPWPLLLKREGDCKSLSSQERDLG